MALTCSQPGLDTVVPGSLEQLSPIQKKALLILYLYRQKNPATSGQALSAATLLSQAACFDCGPSESMLQAFEVWIQRQAAADAGDAQGTFSPSAALALVCGLTCLPMHRLRAIEVMLRCQNA